MSLTNSSNELEADHPSTRSELAHDLQQQLFGADDGGAPEVEQDLEEDATPDDEAEQDDYDAAAQEALDELEGGPVASGSSAATASTSAAKKQAAQKGSLKGAKVVAGQKTVDWSNNMVKSRFRKRYNVSLRRPRRSAPVSTAASLPRFAACGPLTSRSHTDPTQVLLARHPSQLAYDLQARLAPVGPHPWLVEGASHQPSTHHQRHLREAV